MDAPTKPACAYLALALLAAALPFSTGDAAGALSDDYAAPATIVRADLTIHIVLAGIGLSGADKSAIEFEVEETFRPLVDAPNTTLRADLSVKVTLAEASADFLEAYAAELNLSFAMENSTAIVGDYDGLLNHLSPYFPSVSWGTRVQLADAERMAAFLDNSAARFPEAAAPQGATRIFLLGPASVPAPYYFVHRTADPDNGYPYENRALNAWGGDGGLFFLDLRAAPPPTFTADPGARLVDFDGVPPIWSYPASTSGRERLRDDIASYVRALVHGALAPSFFMPPASPYGLRLNVNVVDVTDGSDLFDPNGDGPGYGVRGMSDILDEQHVEASLKALLPSAAVDVVVKLLNPSTDPVIVNEVRALTVDEDRGTTRIFYAADLLDGHRARFVHNCTDTRAPGGFIEVDAIIAVYSTYAFAEEYGTLGYTVAYNNQPCPVIVLAMGYPMLEYGGFTYPLVHEAGHALGFGHPHELLWRTSDGGIRQVEDWLMTLTSTPMSYLMDVEDTSFDDFDRASLWYGAALWALESAYEQRERAFDFLERKGYTSATLPAALAEDSAALELLLDNATAALEAGPPIGRMEAGDEVSSMAVAAYTAAAALASDAAVAPRCCGPNLMPVFAVTLIAITVVAAAAPLLYMRRTARRAVPPPAPAPAPVGAIPGPVPVALDGSSDFLGLR